jgi:hypothetical protein
MAPTGGFLLPWSWAEAWHGKHTTANMVHAAWQARRLVLAPGLGPAIPLCNRLP